MSNPYLTNEPTEESLPPWDINPNHFNQIQLIVGWKTNDTMEDESQQHGSFWMDHSLDLPQQYRKQQRLDTGNSATHPIVPPTLQDHPVYYHPIGQYPPQLDLASALSQQMVQNPTPTLGIGITGDSGSNTCAHANCGKHFPSRAKLNDHARKENHRAFLCLCGSGFTRSDALTRHAKGHSPEQSAKFECPLCEKHDGEQAFKRRDNLRQHLVVVHRLEGGWLQFFTALDTPTSDFPLMP
ncbi:hypothetical protein V8F33_001957 [Rhypophila sp. PSN 637]